MASKDPTLDLVIVGGGPAGMAAALVAGRARLRTLIVNAESPRNAVTGASHGFLTRDGAHPQQLLSVAKEQLSKYRSVEYVVGTASDIKRAADRFQVAINGAGRKATRRVLVATGYRDELDALSLPGINAVYGQSVFPCPFCDGFEHADQRLAVFMADGVESFVPVVRVWSQDVVVFTNGRALPSAARRELLEHGIPVKEARVVELISDAGQLQAVRTQNGKLVERDAGFIGDDYSTPATTFAAALGVQRAVNAWGMEVFEADELGRTSVEHLYLAGDAKHGFAGLMRAASEGAACAEHIVHEIAQQRWREGAPVTAAT